MGTRRRAGGASAALRSALGFRRRRAGGDRDLTKAPLLWKRRPKTLLEDVFASAPTAPDARLDAFKLLKERPRLRPHSVLVQAGSA